MFEKIAETLNTTGKVVSEKAKMGTDIAKINFKITSEERELTELYEKVGRIYYKTCKSSPADSESAAVFAEISQKLESVKELRAQLRSIKKTIECTNCGAECAAEDDFCSKCGTKLEKPAPAPAETSCGCGCAEAPAESSDIKVEVVDDNESAE